MPGPFDYVKGICYIRGVAKYENLYGLILLMRYHVIWVFMMVSLLGL